MSRPRKPTHLKLLDGNPGKRAITPPPKVSPERPIAPPHLSDEAKREWGYLVPRLDEIGMLSKIDRTALEIYCESVSTWRAATAILHEGGVLIRGDKGRIVKNPAAQIARDAATTVRLIGSEFGLTPASRERMALLLGGTGGDDELDAVLEG